MSDLPPMPTNIDEIPEADAAEIEAFREQLRAIARRKAQREFTKPASF